jgi:pyridoxal phosphate enzyme (YggS family)
MTEQPDMAVISALQQVRQRISEYEVRYHRVPGSVQLMAVSKRKPVSAILAAARAGQRAFGENYVDEGEEKILAIRDPRLVWHFVGAIQSRKSASIARHFHWAHGVDRIKVARRLSAQRINALAPLNICLQVNVDNEPGKAGVSPGEITQLAAECAALPGIAVRGIMAIPAPRTDFSEQREVFASVRRCLAVLQQTYPAMDTLSMGMSGDLEAAVAEGATIVRIGTAIFGERNV